jgi:hypothetical protein
MKIFRFECTHVSKLHIEMNYVAYLFSFGLDSAIFRSLEKWCTIPLRMRDSKREGLAENEA